MVERGRSHYTATVLRRWLLLLICLALSLQAPAFARPAQGPCPMQAEMAAMVEAGGLAAGDLHECCNDAETIAQTGKTCKSAPEYSPTTVALPHAPAHGAAVLLRHELPPPALTVWGADPPASPWRPPASR